MPQIAQATDKVWPGCEARHIGHIPLFQRIILHGCDFAALGAHLARMVSLLNDTG
jgi:hypothetical protein